MAVDPEVLVAIIMVATGDTTKATIRVVAEVEAMEETAMTATAMVSAMAPSECKVVCAPVKMWSISSFI